MPATTERRREGTQGSWDKAFQMGEREGRAGCMGMASPALFLALETRYH